MFTCAHIRTTPAGRDCPARHNALPPYANPGVSLGYANTPVFPRYANHGVPPRYANRGVFHRYANPGVFRDTPTLAFSPHTQTLAHSSDAPTVAYSPVTQTVAYPPHTPPPQMRQPRSPITGLAMERSALWTLNPAIAVQICAGPVCFSLQRESWT